jgi:tRNA (Thr-GGU) A37 N-methylase
LGSRGGGDRARAALRAGSTGRAGRLQPCRDRLRVRSRAADTIETGARHPRNRIDWPLVGIFAQRGKNRPNRIGITICRIEKVEGKRLHVRGLDAIDGTPVIDIKPVLREFLPRGDIRQPEWASELMTGYWQG